VSRHVRVHPSYVFAGVALLLLLVGLGIAVVGWSV
jgi:hypothetical protein